MEGGENVMPLAAAVELEVFSIAFAAASLAPSSGGAFLASSGAGTGTFKDMTFGFEAVAPGVSPPIDRVFTTGGPEVSEGLGGVGFC